MVVILERLFGTHRNHPNFLFNCFLFSVLVFITFSFAFFIYYNLFVAFFIPMLVANTASFFLCIVSGYFFMAKRRYRLAAAILQVIISIDTFILILISGNQEFSLAFAFLTPVLGVYLMGYKKGLILSVAYFGAVFWVCLTQMDNWRPAQFLPISLIHFSFTYVLLLSVSFFYDTSRRKAHKMMEEMNNQLHELAITDALTKLRNRRFMEDKLLSFDGSKHIAMLDVDDFKKVNDQFGHDQGDKVLIQLADLLKNFVCSKDVVGRWGGEEFMVIFHEPDLTKVQTLLHELNQLVSKTRFSVDRQITISIGLGTHNAEQHRESLRLVDQALYDAKASGKNCFCLAS